jgi:hypothetical protein
MLLDKYLPNLLQYEVELKDRLGRDPQNDTLKDFLIIINEIKNFKKGVSDVPDKLSNKDLGSLDETEIKEIIQHAPAVKEELEYYLLNKSLIESLKKYLEASAKVDEAAKNFFRKK